MNAISQNPSLFKDFTGFPMENGKFYAAQFNQVTTSQENSKDITILTAEGDKVTISADSQRTSQYTTYNGLARVNDMSMSLQGKSISIDSSSEFSMIVEGDLNEQEMKDIQKAMKTIDKIMQSVLSGNSENTMAMVNKIGNLGSISSFEATMESKNSVIVEQAFMMVAEGATEAVSDGEIEGSTSNQDSLKPATDKIMDIVDSSGIKPSKFIKPLNQYLSNHLDRISGDDNVHPKRLEMGKRMRSEILDRIKQLNEAKEGISESVPVNEGLPKVAENIASVSDGSANIKTDPSIMEA